MSEIGQFEGEYHWLSNFSEEGGVKPTVEHHYQAAKTFNERDKERIMKSPTPGIAKKLGRKVELREDWEDNKLAIMRALLQRKFTDPTIRAKLLATGDAKLTEGNWWGDTYWGVCDGIGENWLGRMLEKVRTTLADSVKPWRCFCQECGSANLKWEAWGSYLDKDLVCQNCKHVVSIWDC